MITLVPKLNTSMPVMPVTNSKSAPMSVSVPGTFDLAPVAAATMPLLAGIPSLSCQTMSGVRCQVSNVRCQVSGVRCQVSGDRCQVSGVRCPVGGLCHIVPWMYWPVAGVLCNCVRGSPATGHSPFVDPGSMSSFLHDDPLLVCIDSVSLFFLDNSPVNFSAFI